MLSYDEMPEDNADLARIQVDFPRLRDDSPRSCPSPMSDLLEYLGMEAPDGDELTENDLRFLRTAKVAERDYWIWEFTEPDGTRCYATVWRDPEGDVCQGYEADDYGLTPEQFLLGDYHNVF